jgi:hypothetical protein
MQGCPFHDHGMSATGQVSSDNRNGRDFINGFLLAILSMEMRRRMVAVEHANEVYSAAEDSRVSSGPPDVERQATARSGPEGHNGYGQLGIGTTENQTVPRGLPYARMVWLPAV